MVKPDQEHPGSGLDKPAPKTLTETVKDKLKEAFVPKPGGATTPQEPVTE